MEPHQKRLLSEYRQLKTRYDKLTGMLDCLHTGMVKETELDCPADLLEQQRKIMGDYLNLLEQRAQAEGVDLTMPDGGRMLLIQLEYESGNTVTLGSITANGEGDQCDANPIILEDKMFRDSVNTSLGNWILHTVRSATEPSQ